MSDDKGTITRQALTDRLKNKAIDWIFMAALAGAAAVLFEPVRHYISFAAKLPETTMDMQEGIRSNSREIQKLRIPRDIFTLSIRSSGAVDGYCIEGQSCKVNVRVRRNPDALDCTLVPGEVKWFYRNPRDNEQHNVTQLGGSPQDVGEGYENFLFTLTTPNGLRPDAELCLRPSYTNCPGQYPDDSAISPDTECMEIEIR